MTRTRAEHRLSLFVAIEYGGTILVESVVGALDLFGDAADDLTADLLALGIARSGGAHRDFALAVPDANIDALWQYLAQRELLSRVLPPDNLLDASTAPLALLSRRTRQEAENVQADTAKILLQSRKDLWREGTGNDATLMYRMTLSELYDLFAEKMGNVGLSRGAFIRLAAKGNSTNRIARLFGAAHMQKVRWH